MGASITGRIWDEASTASVSGVVERFEADWRTAAHTSRPDPSSYVHLSPEHREAALLALMRTDLALRFEAGEAPSVDHYLHRYPELDSESLVALIYEEFCLREEAGENPEPAAYELRFPHLASALRRVFEIHDLVGSGRTASYLSDAHAGRPAYPEVGQTIGGFHLVSELGRGSFARVFLAEERQLANRPVALKVARTGSREPQTLARLQHTHIVPVYSYRVDPVTGLHLLCMPFLGGVTLAHLLADEAVAQARTGAELVAVLDRLEPGDTAGSYPAAEARRALASRDFAPAIAWWGARMAEALEHAHERGVLHRDIKPSNVMVTSDGVPLLADFNLAWESCLDSDSVAPETLGGTLAYMAPEHLRALTGESARVDERSDIYSLGVMLYEAVDRRPFPAFKGARSAQDALRRAIAQRRAGPPRLRPRQTRVPPELEAVILHCLEPDPANRYRSARDLAQDLQAVADDGPLRFASEPFLHRVKRAVRRNRVRLATIGPVVAGLALAITGVERAKFQQAHSEGQILGEVRRLVQVASNLAEPAAQVDDDEVALALADYRSARELAGETQHPDLLALQVYARDRIYHTLEIQKVRRQADTLFNQLDDCWLWLLGLADSVPASRRPENVLHPFFVLENNEWWRRNELTLLDEARHARLLREVDDLLFLWALHLQRTGGEAERSQALALCQRGMRVTSQPETWATLRRLCEERGESLGAATTAIPGVAKHSSRVCFRWALLEACAGHDSRAIEWMEQACQGQQDNYWYHFFLAYLYERTGVAQEQVLAHYNTAVALRPELPWARFNRSRNYCRIGAWGRAIEDLETALSLTKGAERYSVSVNIGLVCQSLGNYTRAREVYGDVLANVPADSPLARAARLNLAVIDGETGWIERAQKALDDLVNSDPHDETARLRRSMLALRTGEVQLAQDDLEHLIRADSTRSDLPEYLAMTCLVRGDAAAAVEQARRSLELKATPARERLLLRCQLAAGQIHALSLSDPDVLAHLPLGGDPLRHDLERALHAIQRDDCGSLDQRLNRVGLLAALGDTQQALAEANECVRDEPDAPSALLMRARLHARQGLYEQAHADVDQGLALEPGDLRFRELRARILILDGRPEEAIREVDRALALGSGGTIHAVRAQALSDRGELTQAIASWGRAIEFDPVDPVARLGRARDLHDLGLVDQALADLEMAASVTAATSPLVRRITWDYLRCLAERPDRLPRVIALGRRVADQWPHSGVWD